MSRPEDPRARAGIRYGIGFALVAAMLLLQPLCMLTYVKLFYERAHELIQPLPPEGMPLPHTLAWSSTTLGLIHRLGPLPLAGVLGWNVALGCLLLYGILRALNPTFRMTSGVDWDHTVLTRTYMHTAPLIKGFLIIVSIFLPAFFAWLFLGWVFGEHAWVILPRMVLFGAVVWLFMSRDGVSGDYESGNYEFPRERSVLCSLLLRGAIAGLFGGLTILWGPFNAPSYYFDLFRTLGGIGETSWRWIFFWCMLFIGGIAFAWGGLMVALGTPGWSPSHRLRSSAPFLAAIAAVYLGWNVWLPGYAASRYDYEPASRISAPVLLAKRAALETGPPQPQQAVLLSGSRGLPMHFTGLSEAGLNASPENIRRIEEYLRKRSYATSLGFPAYITLMDAQALQWNADGMLRTAMMNLEHGADPEYVRTLLEKLTTTAATPEAVKIAGQFADDSFTVYSDRNSYVEMGDLLAALGQKAKAQDLYKKANLPPQQVISRSEEHTMFAEGQVHGRIFWNGKAIPGLKVGVVPVQAFSLLGERTSENGETHPYWLSSVSASARTGASGEFALDHLVAGRYYLLVEAATVHRLQKRDIIVRDAPDQIELSFVSKSINVGDVHLNIVQPGPPPALQPQTKP